MDTGKAAHEKITELENPFISLRKRYEKVFDIVYNRYDYAADLSVDLGASRKSFGPSNLRTYKDRGKASLRNNISIHLEPVKGTREESADRLELLQSHDILVLDDGGRLRDSMHHFQVLGPLWAGWVEPISFPEVREKGESQEKWLERSKEARESHYPLRVLDLDYAAVSFTENQRRVNFAGKRTTLPYIDLLEQYAESYGAAREDKDKVLQICREHFPWIRPDEERPMDASDWDWFSHQFAEIIVTADKGTISHYVDLGQKFKNGRMKNHAYEPIAEGDYPNELGDVPLVLCEGVYNPHQPIQYRREGIIHSLIEMEHGESFYRSFMASMTSTPQKTYEEMSDQVQLHILQNPDDRPPDFGWQTDENGQVKIGRPLGPLRNVPREMDPIMEVMLTRNDRDKQLATPGGIFSDPQANQRLQNIPVSSVLAQQDVDSDLKGEAQRSEMNAWNRILDMAHYYRKHKLNGHREDGDAASTADWNHTFRTTGEERVKGRETKGGEIIEVKASDYDGDYVRSIEPVDNRASTRAAVRAEADHAFDTGMMIYDKKLEAYGIEDRTSFKKTKYQETIFQIEAPGLIMDVRAKVAQAAAIIRGTTIEEQLIGLGPEVAQQMAGAFGASKGYSQGSNTPMMQVASPQMNNIGPNAASQESI